MTRRRGLGTPPAEGRLAAGRRAALSGHGRGLPVDSRVGRAGGKAWAKALPISELRAQGPACCRRLERPRPQTCATPPASGGAKTPSPRRPSAHSPRVLSTARHVAHSRRAASRRRAQTLPIQGSGQRDAEAPGKPPCEGAGRKVPPGDGAFGPAGSPLPPSGCTRVAAPPRRDASAPQGGSPRGKDGRAWGLGVRSGRGRGVQMVRGISGGLRTNRAGSPDLLSPAAHRHGPRPAVPSAGLGTWREAWV